MFTVLCSCSLSHNDNGNLVTYNIKYSGRNIHQKIEKIVNENVNLTKTARFATFA